MTPKVNIKTFNPNQTWFIESEGR